MITVKEAFESAKGFLEQVYPDEADNLNVTLEEIEISDDERFWNVTLGFNKKGPPATTLELLGGSGLNPRRSFKVFNIRADNGIVRSMKMR